MPSNRWDGPISRMPKGILWYEKHSALLRTVEKALALRAPGIKLEALNGSVAGKGPFPVVCLEEEVGEPFQIGIIFPVDYPNNFPKIINLDSRIPLGPNAEWHIESENVACLGLVEQIWLDVGDPRNIELFLSKTVNDYFIQQSYKIIKKVYLSEWKHETPGRLDFYYETFPQAGNDPFKIYAVLGIVTAKEIKGHHSCPFCYGKKIRDCHIDMLKIFKSKIRNDYLLAAYAEIGKHLKNKTKVQQIPLVTKNLGGVSV